MRCYGERERKIDGSSWCVYTLIMERFSVNCEWFSIFMMMQLCDEAAPRRRQSNMNYKFCVREKHTRVDLERDGKLLLKSWFECRCSTLYFSGLPISRLSVLFSFNFRWQSILHNDDENDDYDDGAKSDSFRQLAQRVLSSGLERAFIAHLNL